MTTVVPNSLLKFTDGMGYKSGDGGAVTQETSKATAVTINKPCGVITTHNAALASGARVTFQVNNSFVANTDVLAVHVQSNGPGDSTRYRADCTYMNNGVFFLTLENLSVSSQSDVVGINFAVIKGASA
jgi:hypothetical protein